MKVQLQQAISLLGQAQTLIDSNVNALSGQIDNSVYDPLYAFLVAQQTGQPGTIQPMIAQLTPLVAAIPDGI